MEIVRHEPTVDPQAMNKAIALAYRRGDDATLDVLLRAKLALARQAADSPDREPAA